MPQDIITNLKANMHYLSRVEQKIAEIILDSPQEFIKYSMSELAGKAGVSQGSIINFSNKFASCGFSELKLKIAGYTNEASHGKFNVVDSGDTLKQALQKNVSSHTEAFDLTCKINDEQSLLYAVEKILTAKRIEIYGIYRSAAVATDLYYQLIELGIHANFVSDILTCAVSATSLTENDLVVAVSSSGKTKDIIDAVKNAKANNVPIVCLTSNAASPLASLSDSVLVASASGRSLSDRNNEIRSSSVLICDTLCSYLRSRLGKTNDRKYSELRSILNSHNVEESISE